MGRDADIVVKFGTALICCVGVITPALSAQPLGRPVLMMPESYRHMPENHPTLPAGAQPSTGAADLGGHASHFLDLRPPTAAESTEWTASREIKAQYMERFPLLHRNESPRERPFPAMSTGIDQGLLVGRARAFAERFRREGLPVARLWENQAALVSLGLNPKGKPGLWLVQKTH